MKMERSSVIGAIPNVGEITNGIGNTANNTVFSSISSFHIEEKENFTTKKQTYLDTQTIYQKEKGSCSNPLLDSIVAATTNPFPYSHMAENGNNIISYKGATFVGNSETNTLCLGDMSDKKNVLSIPLSDGGTLMVNRDNIGQLAKAIDMFSPKDINRIMKAISTDAKAKSKEIEIENMKMEVFKEKDE